MSKNRPASDEALKRFLQRVWRQDVAPLLRDRQARLRKKTAATTGRVAATGGLLLDSLLHLRGRPFTRFMTVMGTTLGAMLPDAWNWEWVRRMSPAERRKTHEHVARQAAELSARDALALFDLSASSSRDDLRQAWRRVSQRWHPDKAADDDLRVEYQTRFVAYRAAYERLVSLYDAGELPRSAAR